MDLLGCVTCVYNEQNICLTKNYEIKDYMSYGLDNDIYPFIVTHVEYRMLEGKFVKLQTNGYDFNSLIFMRQLQCLDELYCNFIEFQYFFDINGEN